MRDSLIKKRWWAGAPHVKQTIYTIYDQILQVLCSIDYTPPKIQGIKTSPGKAEEKRDLLPGPNGMAVCTWADGSSWETDVPNLLLTSRENAKVIDKVKKPKSKAKGKAKAKGKGKGKGKAGKAKGKGKAKAAAEDAEEESEDSEEEEDEEEEEEEAEEAEAAPAAVEELADPAVEIAEAPEEEPAELPPVLAEMPADGDKDLHPPEATMRASALILHLHI